MISGLGFGQVAQFQSKPQFKGTCLPSIYFISPSTSSSSVTPSFNLLPHLHSSLTSFFFLKSPWSDKNLFAVSSFSSLFSHYFCLFIHCRFPFVHQSLRPRLYGSLPLHTGQFMCLCCSGAEQVTDNWVTDTMLLCFPLPSTQLKTTCPDTKTHKKHTRKHSWFMTLSADCGANYTVLNAVNGGRYGQVHRPMLLLLTVAIKFHTQRPICGQ